MNRFCCLTLLTGSILSAAPALAQVEGSGFSASGAQLTKPIQFEVFSIRPHKPGTESFGYEYLPDGFRVTWPLYYVITLAYRVPGLPSSSVQVLHAPDWIGDEWYDIDARVATQDIEAWQKAGPDIYGSEALHSALRAALRERCKLAIHTATVEIPYWNLVVNKRGAKLLQETVPGAIKLVPGKTSVAGKGLYIEDKGRRQFIGVSMQDLATVLMRLTKDYPVQDKTGLTGRYDFILPWYSPQQYPASEISDPLERMPLDSIGLKLEMGKGPGFVVDIDHVERPSSN